MNTWFPTLRPLAETWFPFYWVWPWHSTAAQRQSLLRLIAVASEENLMLSPLLEAWAVDERGYQQRRLLRLASLLAKGTPLPDAVEEVPSVLRDEDILAIRFGAQSGTLPAAVRAILDESKQESASISFKVRNQLFYLYVVLAMAVPIVAFMQVKIAPEIYEIWEDFGLEQVKPVEWSHQFADVLATYWWVGLFVAVALTWSIYSQRPGRFLRQKILGRFHSWQELRAADVLQKLSVAMAAGRPIPGALSTLARYHFDPAIRHKLLFVRNEVEQGADVWQSMKKTGLVTPPEAHLLASAERVGNRPWALSQLASLKRRRTMRRLERMSELLLPILVLAMGGFVLLQALTIFLPLMKLIGGLS